MPKRPPTRAGGPTYRLVLQREDTAEVVAQWGHLAQDTIRPVLEGLSAVIHAAGFRRDLAGLLGRMVGL